MPIEHVGRPKVDGWVSAISWAVLSVAGVAGIVLAVALESVPLGVVCAVVAIAAVFLAIRTPRAGLDLTDDTLIVRGYFWTRRVPRAAITDVRYNATVEWTDGNGIPRATFLGPFMTYSSDVPTPGTRDLEYALSRIRAWVRARNDS